MEIRNYRDDDWKSWNDYVLAHPDSYNAHLIHWKKIVEDSYRKKSYYLIAEENKKIIGVLPLFHIKGFGFGDHLVSMPYLTYGGVLADNATTLNAIIEKAISLSSQLRTDFLTLRHTNPLIELDKKNKASLNNSKVSMRLQLPDSSDELFNSFKSKLRSQIRRPLKADMMFKVGKKELLDDFYSVFCVNMKGLGSPVHSKQYFSNILDHFKENSKIGIVYYENIPVAAGFITIHKKFVEIPWASSLKEFNKLSPNMLLYWSFLKYSIEIGASTFDFGRSTPGEGTYKFKEQWQTKPVQLNWYNISDNTFDEESVSNSKKELFAFIWNILPLSFCNFLGPIIRKNISL